MRERSSVHIIFHAGLAIFFFTRKFILRYLEYSWWSSEKFSQMLVHSNRKWLGTQQPGWYDDQTARKLTKPFSLDLYNGSNFSWIANAIIGAFVSTFSWQPTKWADIADGAPGGSVGSARQWRQRTTCPSVQDQNKISNRNGARIFSKFTFQSIALRLVQIRWRKKQRKVRFGTVCLSSRIPRDWRANIDKVGRQNGCKIEVGFQSLLAIYRWKQALVGFAFKIIKSETEDIYGENVSQ